MRRFRKTIIILFISGYKIEASEAEPSETEVYEAETAPSASPVENMIEAELSKYTEEEYNEAILSMTLDEVSDYLKECNEHQHYQISILESMTDQLQVWFPNLDMWGCDIIDKTEKGYIADIYNYDIYDEIGYEVETEYIAYKTQILIKPDFSIEILPDTIEVDPKKGFCIYASDQEFAYNGCRMGIYYAEYYIQEKDFYLKAAIPLFSLKDGLEGNEINSSIWEALKKWADEQENWANGEMQMDYEIMRLDNDLFSILLSGEWEPENGKTEKSAIGITVSMSDGDLLEETVFAGEGKKDSYFGYYVKDNEMFLIENKEGNYITVKENDVQFKGYYVERKTANVYTSEGEWRGECYYDIPQIYYVVDEAEAINKELKKEMGKYFNGLAQTFAEEIKKIDGIDDPSEGPGYRCNVKSRVYKNNGKEFGIEYHYKLWLEEILEEGDAVICFDVESGVILEYQDWQSEMVKKIELWKRNEEKNNVEELDFGFDPVTQNDVDQIGKMSSLKKLEFHIQGSDIDLSPLKNLNNLEELCIISGWGEDNLDTTALGKLKQIKKITLVECDFDTTFLAQLTNLESVLLLKCTNVKDLSIFENLKSLQDISISYVDYTDLNCLKNLIELKVIDIAGANIRNFDGLKI